MPRAIPKDAQWWPDDAENLATTKVVEMYESGFAGAYMEPEVREAMLNSQLFPDGMAAASHFGLAESGAGKLSLPFYYSWKNWPKAWPSPGQTTGSCVSKAGKNIGFILIGVDVASGTADEATGLVEGFPEVSSEAERNGVVASEPIYGDRGHSGQGASCGRLIGYVMTRGGILLRQNYESAGVDLTEANDSIGARWGGSGTPGEVNAEGKKHQIRQGTECQNHEVVRDFLANGYANWVCSGYGWSSKRDKNGYSKQSGRWSHSWVIMGYDDRPETVQEYGFPLALYNHDWGIWNSGPRDIRASADHLAPDFMAELKTVGLVNQSTGNLLIPEGSMWIDARLLDNCECTAMSSINGFPRRVLPDLGASGII